MSLALERYEKGEYPNELRKLNLAEEKARSEFDRTKESFEQVPQLAEDPGLAFEARDRLIAGQRAVQHHLDRHDLLIADPAGLEDDPHAAAADLFQ